MNPGPSEITKSQLTIEELRQALDEDFFRPRWLCDATRELLDDFDRTVAKLKRATDILNVIAQHGEYYSAAETAQRCLDELAAWNTRDEKEPTDDADRR